MLTRSARAPLAMVAVDMAKTYSKNQVMNEVEGRSAIAKFVLPAFARHQFELLHED